MAALQRETHTHTHCYSVFTDIVLHLYSRQCPRGLPARPAESHHLRPVAVPVLWEAREVKQLVTTRSQRRRLVLWRGISILSLNGQRGGWGREREFSLQLFFLRKRTPVEVTTLHLHGTSEREGCFKNHDWVHRSNDTIWMETNAPRQQCVAPPLPGHSHLVPLPPMLASSAH